MPIIFVTDFADVATTVRAMKAGAQEFFTRPLNDAVVLGAIRHAIDRSEVALTRAAEMRVLRDRFATLTSRERQVMDLVAGGNLNKVIGGGLEISEITVKAHRGKVMRKMKAANLADLVNKVWMLRAVLALPADMAYWTSSVKAVYRARQVAAITSSARRATRFATEGVRFGVAS